MAQQSVLFSTSINKLFTLETASISGCARLSCHQRVGESYCEGLISLRRYRKTFNQEISISILCTISISSKTNAFVPRDSEKHKVEEEISNSSVWCLRSNLEGTEGLSKRGEKCVAVVLRFPTRRSIRCQRNSSSIAHE